MACRDTFQLRLAVVAATIAVLIIDIAEASRMFNLCSHTAYPALCHPFVGRISSPRRATHKTVQAMEVKTKLALVEAARFKEGNQAITTCYATMRDAEYNLMNARKSIRKRDVMAMNMYLTAVVSDYGACVDAFIETRQINTLQNVADELRKMSSNCLSLSTLIR